MSNTNSKMEVNDEYDNDYNYENPSFNDSLIKLQKKKMNRLRNKYNKMMKNIEKTDLEFNDLKDEMNFLNTIYYLNTNIDDLITNIENINLALYQKQEKDNVEITEYIKNKIEEERKLNNTITSIFPYIYNKVKFD